MKANCCAAWPAVAAIDAAAESGDPRTGALRLLGVYHTGLLLPQMVAARHDVRESFAALGPEAGLAASLHARWTSYARSNSGRSAGRSRSGSPP